MVAIRTAALVFAALACGAGTAAAQTYPVKSIRIIVGVTPPNMRKDLHLVLELARELGVNLYLGTQGSLIADAGTAIGHGDPRL